MWEIVKNEFEKPYFKKLINFVEKERKNKNIYPNSEDVFRAFTLTKFNDLKVIILGQDPYHVPKMADGLAFSSRLIKTPKSLLNIKKELFDDLGYPITKNNSLELWASQGVLLLNTVLTVEENKAHSHKDMGWEEFTLNVFKEITKLEQPLVFILWGNHAIKYSKYVKNKNHLVIKSAHPSPLSAYRGFFGSKPFSQTNNFLEKNNIAPINFQF